MFVVIKQEAYMVKTEMAINSQVLSVIAVSMGNNTIETVIITHTKKNKLDSLIRIVKIKTELTSLMWGVYI